MKKPSITGGEWEIYESNNTIVGSHELGLEVCQFDYKGNDGEEKYANATAISAVPEMIDALMSAVTWMKHVHPEGHEVATLKMIRALEKAGVEL